jgi:integrase
MAVQEFSYADAEDFQNWLAEKVKLRTANSYIKCVRVPFSWAVRRGWIEANPFDGLKPYRVPDVEVRTYTAAEIRKLLDAARNTLMKGRIWAAVGSGLRRGEIYNLTWDDIDAERQMITVRAKDDDHDKGTWGWAPKDYEHRQVPIPPQLNNLLLLLRTDLPIDQAYPFLTEKRYFTLRRRIGELPERVRNTPDDNKRPWENILRVAEIRDGTFHDLRRTAISHWARYLPIRDVMELAGHSSIETTQKYYLALGPDYIEKSRQVSAQICRGDWT